MTSRFLLALCALVAASAPACSAESPSFGFAAGGAPGCAAPELGACSLPIDPRCAAESCEWTDCGSPKSPYNAQLCPRTRCSSTSDCEAEESCVLVNVNAGLCDWDEVTSQCQCDELTWTTEYEGRCVADDASSCSFAPEQPVP